MKGTSHPTLTNRTYFEQVRGKQLRYIVSLAWLVPGKLYHCNLYAQWSLHFFAQIQSFCLIKAVYTDSLIEDLESPWSGVFHHENFFFEIKFTKL